MKIRFLIFILAVFSVTSGWSFGKSKKQKVIDCILSNKNVAEIVEIRGYDDWETKYFFVKLILTDGTRIMLRGVDFKLNGNKTKDLHFIEIWTINDFNFVQLEFDYSKFDYICLEQFQNPPSNSTPLLSELYKNKSLDFLLDNHVSILDEMLKYPHVPDSFVEKFIENRSHDVTDLKNYDFVNFTAEKGEYPVVFKSTKYSKW